EFSLKIQTPTGWNQLTDYSSVLLRINERKLKVLSFHIYESTPVGDYNIQVQAFDKSNDSLIGAVKIPVYVKPRYEVLIKTLQAPKYVVSGDSLTVGFLIHNLSNVNASMRATIINGSKTWVQNLSLEADSSEMLNISLLTIANLQRSARQAVSLSVNFKDAPEISSTNSYLFDILPNKLLNFDVYRRVPIKATGLFVSDQSGTKQKYGAMFDIRGSASLSSDNQHNLEFHFRGPNRNGNPLLGLNDKYFASYSSPKTRIILGDYNYRLSDLTESSRNGIGVLIERDIGNLSTGAFLNYPRYYPKIRRLASGWLSFEKEKKYTLLTGYLNKQYETGKSAHLLTVSGNAFLKSWGQINVELAAGKRDNLLGYAMKTRVYAKNQWVRAYVNYTLADHDFPGYFSNTSYFSSGVGTKIKKSIDLAANYDFNHSNIALDTLYSNAPLSQNASLTANYRIKSNNIIGLALYMRSREDRSEPKLFDYAEQSARLTIQNKFKSLGISSYGEIGKVKNFLTLNEGETTRVFKANVSVIYKLNSILFIESFINYQGGKKYLLDDFNRFYYGTSVNLNWQKGPQIRLSYQNNYEIEEYYRDRSLLSLSARYRIHHKHEIGLGTHYNLVKNSLNKKEFNAFIRYTYIIDVPVAKKNNLGSLKGKVNNLGVRSVEGIVFSLSGNIAICNKSGEFSFPAVLPGVYYLLINYSNLGINSIADQPGPYQIIIEPGMEKNFTISMTKSATIKGRIVLQSDANKNNKGYVQVKETLGKLIIEAKNKEEIFRVLTKENGTFEFLDLRPGFWNIKVYKTGIPQGYTLITEQVNIDLASGQVHNLDVLIKKKSIQIKFQKKL
ncbi:MAG: hypothetical protein HN936_00810, partial [Bacteroidetes bacterium]|nr:hypothetical protein [Bacteroidota bacterium]